MVVPHGYYTCLALQSNGVDHPRPLSGVGTSVVGSITMEASAWLSLNVCVCVCVCVFHRQMPWAFGAQPNQIQRLFSCVLSNTPVLMSIGPSGPPDCHLTDLHSQRPRLARLHILVSLELCSCCLSSVPFFCSLPVFPRLFARVVLLPPPCAVFLFFVPSAGWRMSPWNDPLLVGMS